MVRAKSSSTWLGSVRALRPRRAIEYATTPPAMAATTARTMSARMNASRSLSRRESAPGTTGRTTTNSCYRVGAARVSTRERQEIRCGGRAGCGPATTRPAEGLGSAQQPGECALEVSLPSRQRPRAIRAEDLCRLATLSTKGEAERVPCSSHVPGSDPPENRARKQPLRRRIGDGRGGWPFARHLQASQQPLDDGGRGCATRQRRSVRWSRQAARTPPCTRRPTPARPRAARSINRWLSAPHDPPVEYIAPSTESGQIEWSISRASQVVPPQPQTVPDHRDRAERHGGARIIGLSNRPTQR